MFPGISRAKTRIGPGCLATVSKIVGIILQSAERITMIAAWMR